MRWYSQIKYLIRYSILLVVLGSFLTSCTFNPFRTDNDLTGSPVGLIAGGATGSTAAAVVGASKPIIGLAGIGGAGLGYYVTTLRFASGGIIRVGGKVYTVGDYLTIEIPSDRLFDVDTADLLPQADSVLSSVVTVLERYPNQNIMISGNTSGFGTERDEQKLSQKRAETVASYLWAHGITSFKNQSNDTRRLIYVGYGDHFPISNNFHNKSIRQNSRIQITSFPSKKQLELDNCHKIFNDIGDPTPSTPPCKTNFTNSNSDATQPTKHISAQNSAPLKKVYKDAPPNTQPMPWENYTTSAAPAEEG